MVIESFKGLIETDSYIVVIICDLSFRKLSDEINGKEEGGLNSVQWLPSWWNDSAGWISYKTTEDTLVLKLLFCDILGSVGICLGENSWIHEFMQLYSYDI